MVHSALTYLYPYGVSVMCCMYRCVVFTCMNVFMYRLLHVYLCTCIRVNV